MKRALMAAAMVLVAATGCESSDDTPVASASPTQTAVAPASADVPTDAILSGAAVSIRSGGPRSVWFVRTGVSFNPEALDAKGPDVVFAAATGPEHFLIEKVVQGSSPGNAIESGDYVRLFNVEHDGWLKADIDNPLFVVSDPRLHGDANARFLIRKTAGSPGRFIKMGDLFCLRGINGEPWLVAPVDGVVTVSRDQAQATQFEFAPPPGP